MFPVVCPTPCCTPCPPESTITRDKVAPAPTHGTGSFGGVRPCSEAREQQPGRLHTATPESQHSDNIVYCPLTERSLENDTKHRRHAQSACPLSMTLMCSQHRKISDFILQQKHIAQNLRKQKYPNKINKALNYGSKSDIS